MKYSITWFNSLLEMEVKSEVSEDVLNFMIDCLSSRDIKEITPVLN